jgi:hypothetical protein
MSDKSPMCCEKCKASYVVDVVSLGHTERDGLRCDCCGEWILREEKRTKAYSIVGVTQHGNICPKRSQLSEFVGYNLRFSKGNECFVGVVKGLSEAVVATASGPIHPWVIVSKDQEIHLDPEDHWNVCRCQNA